MENKRKFIEKLSTLFMMYSNAPIANIEYIKREAKDDENYIDTDEYVKVSFTGNYYDDIYINIDGDNCLETMYRIADKLIHDVF